MADNLHYDIVAQLEHLDATLDLIGKMTRWGKPERYRIDAKYGMILYWHKSGNGDHKPCSMMFTKQIEEWLHTCDPTDFTIFDKENMVDSMTTWYDGYDVGNSKGFRIRTGQWGQIDHDHYAYAHITPRVVVVW